MSAVIEKRCQKCGKTKPAAEFYASKQTKDGLKGHCRVCHGECVVRTMDLEKKLASNAAHMRRARRADPEKFSERDARLAKKRDRLKDRVRLQTRRAVAAGKLLKATCCERCGSEVELEAHHPDYSKPYDVRWLCVPCHAKQHRTRQQPTGGTGAATQPQQIAGAT